MGNTQNAQNSKPPPDYVRPVLTDEEVKKLNAYVDDERRNQLSEEEQQKKCGAHGKYQKPCPAPIEVCRPRSKEPDFVCVGEKKEDRLPECSESRPLQKPPKCPVDEAPCTSDDVIGPAVLHKKEAEIKIRKSSGTYKCEPDDDDEPC